MFLPGPMEILVILVLILVIGGAVALVVVLATRRKSEEDDERTGSGAGIILAVLAVLGAVFVLLCAGGVGLYFLVSQPPAVMVEEDIMIEDVPAAPDEAQPQPAEPEATP